MPAKRPWERKISSNLSAVHAASDLSAVSTPTTVRAIFDSIAPAYDRFNAWASLGRHHAWRRALVNKIPIGMRVLDLATGTGDVALLAADSGHEVVGLDFSEAMLARAHEKDGQHRIQWVAASADQIPFADRSFGCVTSAFALRNLRSCLEATFGECARVLQPGGKVLHMDFGRPTAWWSRWGHALRLRIGIRLIGRWICGEQWPEKYLEQTIHEFYAPAEVEQRLRTAGFRDVTYTSLLGGTVLIYEGIKC